ncbi:hypothetical protein KQX54_008688 [Cotesia glomerata]|uniref:Uncharacterized protein n=1 Tax=Cotesia glomerata TaxID=32391 RepID=A0AAV7IZB6_COTGL|nr:hypothetical protein KQX54_008688 [Cotesia glomerata]
MKKKFLFSIWKEDSQTYHHAEFSTIPICNFVMCILEFEDAKIWVKLETPVIYEDFLTKAQDIFPFLANRNFYFTNANDAKLDFILVDYILNNPHGVILKIKTTDKRSEKNLAERSSLFQEEGVTTYSQLLFDVARQQVVVGASFLSRFSMCARLRRYSMKLEVALKQLPITEDSILVESRERNKRLRQAC